MTRILPPLAIVAIAMVLIALALGYYVSSLDIRNPADASAQQWASWHRLAGIGSGLVLVLVHSIVVTYFIGTSRWCREVSEVYEIGPEFVATSNRAKRRAFPWAALGMLVAVGLVASGGAADPGASLRPPAEPQTMSWAVFHMFVALAAIAFTALAFGIEWLNLDANHKAIDGVLAEVRRIRHEHGLED